MDSKYLSLIISALLAPGTMTTAHASEEVVVTGTYSSVKMEQLASTVSVIDRAELLRLSNHSLVDALRQVPGVWIEEQGGPGGLTAITLRGAESNHTLVMVDGVQMNDPTNSRGGAFDVGNININSIKRVEIIRGAQSAIYGSDALAGVINIITIESTSNQQQNLYVGLGEDGYSTANISASGTADRIGYAVKAQVKDAGEPITGSTGKSKELLSKLDWLSDEHKLNILYRYFNREKTSFPEQSGGPLLAQTRALDNTDFTGQNAALNWHWQIHETWASSLRSSWFNREESFASPGVAPYTAVPPNGADTEFSRTDLSWVNTFGDENSFWSNVGGEIQKETGNSEGYLDVGMLLPTSFDLSRRVDSVFVNINRYFGPDLLVQASLRRDDPEEFAANLSSQFGVRYQLTSDISWLASWGEGFKLPSFFALGHPLVGNPDLQPETSTTWDTGVEWTHEQSSARVTYFTTRFRDLIDFDSALFTNVNRARVDTQGAEAELDWRPVDQQWQFMAHASYTDVDAENPLMNRPQLKAGSLVGYSLNHDLHLNLQYLWVDERFASSYYTGASQLETLDSYSRFDGSVNWQVNRRLNVNLSVENLADAEYFNDIGFPNAGRTFHVSAHLSL
jgi:vitamin B12 transporter